MKIHLVDGTYELFRSHFGAPPKNPAMVWKSARRWGVWRNPKQFSTPYHFSARTASRRPPQRGYPQGAIATQTAMAAAYRCGYERGRCVR